MSNAPTTKPPTPRRCRCILEAHHLDCQALSLRQIADRPGCAHSTVHAYLRDFQLHRAHILRTVAADQLAEQVYQLTQSQTEPDQHRRHVASTRELRLLLLSLPAIQQHDERQGEPANAPIDDQTNEQFPNSRVDADGHRRYIAGPDNGQCVLARPRCVLGFYANYSDDLDDDPDQPGLIKPDQDQASQDQEESGQIQTNLDKSEHQSDEFLAPDKEFTVPSQISPQWRSPKPVGPHCPASWHNLIGYIPPQDENSPMIKNFFESSKWR